MCDHRYAGIFGASKVLWVYEGRLPERRAMCPVALAQREEVAKRPLLFDCEVKSESESESIFGPLIFFNLRYIKGGVRGNNNIGIKKCTTNFLWVLNFGQVGELPQQFSKSHYYGDFFQKWSPTCDFLKKVKGFPYKIEGEFFQWDFF